MSLVSDAGTPLLSDPGKLLVKECILKNIDVIPIPGPSSITAAMSIASFDDKFIFYGFLPKKEKELGATLNKLSKIDLSLIFFVPSIKINFYIKFFKKYFEDREILIAREITKIHETFYRSTIQDLKLFTTNLKGELTVVLSKKNIKKESNSKEDLNMMKSLVKKYLKIYSLKDTVNLISSSSDISKKTIYDYCLKLRK